MTAPQRRLNTVVKWSDRPVVILTAPPVHLNTVVTLRKTCRYLSEYNVPIDVDINFDPNPILWTLENTLIPIRGRQTVPLLL